MLTTTFPTVPWPPELGFLDYLSPPGEDDGFGVFVDLPEPDPSHALSAQRLARVREQWNRTRGWPQWD